MTTPPRILVLAGSDSSGGAGIQADIKTITLCGGYAATAITALTAQNTLGVSAIHAVPEEFMAAQMRACLSDIGADMIKTGMLHRLEIMETIHARLQEFADLPRVVDPVMIAKGGTTLLKPDAIEALKHFLIRGATLVTPNIPEAEHLSGRTIDSVTAMKAAGEEILAQGAHAVLIKGGHATGDILTDLLVTASGITEFSSPRRNTPHTHGTGCTLASAIATFLAHGHTLETAIEEARSYLLHAIDHAPGFGKGHGPLGIGKATPPHTIRAH